MTHPPFAAPTPHAVPLPDPLARTIRTRATALGVAVLAISLAVVPALLIAPYSLVPYADPMRLGVPLFAGITGCCLVGAGVFTLVARRSVADGHLRLNAMRISRAGLLFAVVLSTISGLLAWGILALVTSSPPERYRDEIQFGAGEWLYVLLLFGAIALVWTCFFVLRPVLWRSQYVAKEWIRWAA